MTYFGLEPYENYIDRNRGSKMGLYYYLINDYYVNSQESSNKKSVIWFSLQYSKVGIKIIGEQPLSTSAWPFAMENIETPIHTNKLIPTETNISNIDLKQMGGGGDDSCSVKAKTHPQYQVEPEPYQYSFTIKPILNESLDNR